MSVERARIQAVLAAVLFSTGGAGIKVEAFDGLQVSSLRSGIAAVALLAFMGARLTWSVPVLLAGVVYAATLTLFVLSTKLTTAANAIFLQSTAPFYLLLLGPIVLRERFERGDVWYLTALAAGVFLCFWGQPTVTATAPDPVRGNILGVLCSVAWAFTLVALRYIERDHSSSGVGLSAVTIGNAIACLVALPFAWPFPTASAGEWGTIVYLGVGQIGVAYLCLTAAIRHLPALEVSLLLLIEPVLNPVWTWLLRGEHPGSWTIAGGAIILTATAVRSLRADTRARTS